MTSFPRTQIGDASVSRMIIGTNWFLGFSHCTPSKDAYIHEHIRDRKVIADILEVFFRAGVDSLIGLIQFEPLADAVKEAEDRTGVGATVISTPAIPIGPEVLIKGFDEGTLAPILDEEQRLGARVCMPHQSTTDPLVDRCTRDIRRMDELCKAIRGRGMIPGLSTHMPESIIYADETGLDVETYVALYNSMGFLMQLEVDWIHRIIQEAKKPVLTIKPFAAGQLRPFQALNFVWNTLRDKDMVSVGTMSPKEAEEVIEMSLGILERRTPDVQLQETRSKASVRTA